MAKPIFTIGFPQDADPEQLRGAQDGLSKKLGEDYHVIVYATSKTQDIKFDLFNVVDVDDSTIEELKQTVLDSLKITDDE